MTRKCNYLLTPSGAPFMSFYKTVTNPVFPFPLAGLNLKLSTTITRNLFDTLAHDTLTTSLIYKSTSLGSIYSRTVNVNPTGLCCINIANILTMLTQHSPERLMPTVLLLIDPNDVLLDLNEVVNMS